MNNCNDVSIVIDQSPVHSVSHNLSTDTALSEPKIAKFSEQVDVNSKQKRPSSSNGIATASLNDGNFSSNLVIVPQQTTNPFNYEHRDTSYVLDIENENENKINAKTDQNTNNDNLHPLNFTPNVDCQGYKNPFESIDEDQDFLPLEDEHISIIVEDQEFQSKNEYNLENVKPSLRKNSFDSDKAASDDANSVEEALRALDFAISGEESLLPDSDDEDENVEDEENDKVAEEKFEQSLPLTPNICDNGNAIAEKLNSDKEIIDICTNNFNVDNSSKVNVNDTDNNINSNSNENETSLQNVLNEFLLNNGANNFKDTDADADNQSAKVCEAVEKERYAAVLEEAKHLVDCIIDECQNVVHNTQIVDSDVRDIINTNPTNETYSQYVASNDIGLTNNESGENEEKANSEPTRNVEVDLDDSIENIFSGKLEASTPYIKPKTEVNEVSKAVVANLFGGPNTSLEDTYSQMSPLSPSKTQANGISTCDIENSHLRKVGDSFLNTEDKLQEDTVLLNGTYNVSPVKSDRENENATFVKPTEDSIVASQTNDVNNRANTTFDVPSSSSSAETKVNTTIILGCSSSTRPLKENPTIRIDKEEATSDDLTTATPMNTPIELNYAGDSWDSLISKSMNPMENRTTLDIETNTLCQPSTSSSTSWFLHPQQIDETYDMGDRCDTDSEEDDSETNAELLSSTFDALRKQLAEALPHASGNVTAPLDFSDNENDSDGDNDDADQMIER